MDIQVKDWNLIGSHDDLGYVRIPLTQFYVNNDALSSGTSFRGTLLQENRPTWMTLQPTTKMSDVKGELQVILFIYTKETRIRKLVGKH